MNESDIQAVRETLRQFQEGYTRRNPEEIDAFKRLFVPADELEMIGTAALEPGDDEWRFGIPGVSSMMIGDWNGWGDVVLDVADARIHTLGDVAWLATTGTVTMVLDAEENYRDTLEYIRQQLTEEDSLSPDKRLLEIIREGAAILSEAGQGSTYVWPLRFTAVLVRQAENWLFHQLQFSFATTRFPDERCAVK
ncbi:MAG: hypothetical protein IH586_17890 [Anaerolineaceae bacterium]|nr:hypothetical protein [Anaerolineaceae bacterium]